MPSRSRRGGGVASGVQGAVRRMWFQLGLHVTPQLVQQHLARRGLEVSLGRIVRIHRELLRGTSVRRTGPPVPRNLWRPPRRPKRPWRRS